LVGVIGSLQALEAIKEIVGVGRSLVGRLLLYDARDTRFETIEYRWDPSNPLNGTSAGR
jgi:adenylyltransferase/sulfurtransferase